MQVLAHVLGLHSCFLDDAALSFWPVCYYKVAEQERPWSWAWGREPGRKSGLEESCWKELFSFEANLNIVPFLGDLVTLDMSCMCPRTQSRDVAEYYVFISLLKVLASSSLLPAAWGTGLQKHLIEEGGGGSL